MIYSAIVKACPNYREKIEIWDGPGYSYKDDGRDIIIRYVGINKNVVQMEVVDSLTSPVTGNEPSF